jgi:hypothetical protein
VKITLVGDQSQAPVSQEFNLLPFTPWASLSVYAGDRGTSVYLEGRGFAPGEDVGVFLGDGTEPLTTGKADDSGRVARLGPLKLPDAQPGQQITFALKGQVSGVQADVAFTVTGSTVDQSHLTPTESAPQR